jgi:hypothetical protein
MLWHLNCMHYKIFQSHYLWVTFLNVTLHFIKWLTLNFGETGTEVVASSEMTINELLIKWTWKLTSSIFNLVVVVVVQSGTGNQTSSNFLLLGRSLSRNPFKVGLQNRQMSTKSCHIVPTFKRRTNRPVYSPKRCLPTNSRQWWLL